ncbi:MAG: proprotein convertase P-domain-containing protein [Flavobacteriaceae bacterium]|nr:proprotein convertase P-domain-containing protein [Flavobacteriaceae bacterium]
MKAKLHFVFPFTIFFYCFCGLAQNGYWKVRPSNSLARQVDSTHTRYLTLDAPRFFAALGAVEGSETGLLYFPDGEGRLHAFQVQERSNFHPKLQSSYPDIKAYVGWDAERSRKVRFSTAADQVSVLMVDLENGRRSFIEPLSDDPLGYANYQNGSGRSKTFECHTEALQSGLQLRPNRPIDDRTLRTFRFAVSTTGEYTEYHGGTIAGALAAINSTLTRVNEVFETDLGVRLELIANTTDVIFTDADTDPYTTALNVQVQNTLTDEIGEANYDVGHLFHRDVDNGNAGFIGSVCVDGRKGSAFSSALIPEGDLFDLDYVAHELGHQFGANHSWSFESEGTGVQFEPASGTTIMGYAGIVAGNNVALNGDDYFHYGSILQISTVLQGASCAATTSLVNSPPVIAPLEDLVIPKGTAFVLEGSATDPDPGTVLTYCWEQIDDGVVTTDTFGPDNVVGANFRSLPPVNTGLRYFPSLSRVLQGQLSQVDPQVNEAWETASDSERELNFALTVRDNAVGGGQVVSEQMNVQVVNAAGPFVVTSQADAGTLSGGSIETVTWDVALTDRAPINATAVDIFLSLDGGNDFSVLLAEDHPNSGMAQVQLPNTATSNARIMVKARNQVFYAVNASEFAISASDFVLDFDQLQYEVCLPNTFLIPFTFTRSVGGTETVDLNASVPAGVSAVFDPAMVNGTNVPVLLTLSDLDGLAVGDYPITVTASTSGQDMSYELELAVRNTVFDALVLNQPQDREAGVRLQPTLQWDPQANASSYDIELATDITFSNIIVSATTDQSEFAVPPLQAETEYYWRVRPKNGCDEGDFSPPFVFTTTAINCNTFSISGLPLEISPDDANTVTATISFAEALVIADVNIELAVSHTFVEDLIIRLISPSGTRVTLLSKNCGSRNDINATFDDDGPVFGCGNNPAINGMVRPLGALSSFNGELLSGEWQLEVEDTAASDGGSIDVVRLEFCVEGQFRPDADQDGVFDDGDDLCLGTPLGTPVDSTGCPLLDFPDNNFAIAILAPSCPQGTDGAFEISVADTAISYQGSLNGNGIQIDRSFSDSTQFIGLPPGRYTLCVTGMQNETTFREACFEVVIAEPGPLQVNTTVIDAGANLTLALGGAASFNIVLNGVSTQTVENSITLPLNEGVNTLQVESGSVCQEAYAETLLVGTDAILYPNPVESDLNVLLNSADRLQSWSVFAADGVLVQRQSVSEPSNPMNLDFSSFASGLYYVVLQFEDRKVTQKVFKR